jgi:hypothetical protein
MLGISYKFFGCKVATHEIDTSYRLPVSSYRGRQIKSAICHKSLVTGTW